MASNELAAKLQRRNQLIERAELLEQQQQQDLQRNSSAAPGSPDCIDSQYATPVADATSTNCCRGDWTPTTTKTWHPYSEFKEFTRKQMQHYQKMFTSYDINKDKYIDFDELKYMMEKLGCPQTHLALKAMIREVDEDHDSKISYREFLLIFRKAMAGELPEDSGLYDIYRSMTEIDVDKEGVKGAKTFFEAKIVELTKLSNFEQEIKDEQEERRRIEEERTQRRQAFKATANLFQQQSH